MIYNRKKMNVVYFKFLESLRETVLNFVNQDMSGTALDLRLHTLFR
jgi:hypothetical protein